MRMPALKMHQCISLNVSVCLCVSLSLCLLTTTKIANFDNVNHCSCDGKGSLGGSDWHGTIVLVVRPGVDAENIRRAASQIFADVGVNKMIIQTERAF